MPDAIELAWRVEEALTNAWPAPRQLFLNGWLLRAGGGPARRTNSVNPLRGGPVDPSPVVAAAEHIYAGRGQPCRFRIPDFVAGMDQPLARLGYRAEGESCTLFAELGDMTADSGAIAETGIPVRIAGGGDERWIAARLRLSGGDAAAEAALRATLGAMILPHACLCSLEDGAVASVAFGAIDAGLLAIEAVVTDPALRRRGHARATVAALLRWAGANGASAACLQVDAGNAAARLLYASLGFTTELYRYHYRSRRPA